MTSALLTTIVDQVEITSSARAFTTQYWNVIHASERNPVANNALSGKYKNKQS